MHLPSQEGLALWDCALNLWDRTQTPGRQHQNGTDFSDSQLASENWLMGGVDRYSSGDSVSSRRETKCFFSHNQMVFLSQPVEAFSTEAETGHQAQRSCSHKPNRCLWNKLKFKTTVCFPQEVPAGSNPLPAHLAPTTPRRQNHPSWPTAPISN